MLFLLPNWINNKKQICVNEKGPAVKLRLNGGMNQFSTCIFIFHSTCELWWFEHGSVASQLVNCFRQIEPLICHFCAHIFQKWFGYWFSCVNFSFQQVLLNSIEKKKNSLSHFFPLAISVHFKYLEPRNSSSYQTATKTLYHRIFSNETLFVPIWVYDWIRYIFLFEE